MISSETGVEVNFRKLLLVQCQKEFEADKDSVVESKKAELDKALESAQNEDEKARLNSDFVAFMDKMRHRKLGFIK